ncbi:MAG: MFS transporter [Dehalococcoidia bacterium]|nr:MFS transporter [Dehalococcoidia bacterium]
MAGVLTRIRTFRSFRYGDFRLLWVASVGTSGGFFFQQVLIGWLTYDLTGSAFLTSVVLGLDTLPNLIAAPLGGVLVDNLDRRKVLAFVPVYQCALSVAFGLVILLGLVEPWHIFVFVLLMGFSWVIIEPARMSIIPGIVGEDRLVNAFSLVQLAFSTTRLVGPVVGGIALASLGPAAAVFVAAGSQFVAMLMGMAIRTRNQPESRVTLGTALSGLAGSFRLVRDTPVVQALLLLALISPLVVVPFSYGLMPVFAAEVYDVGPALLGALLSLIGAGSMIGTIVLASMLDVPRKGYAAMAGVLISAAGLVMMALAPSFPVAALAALVVGIGFTSAQTLVSSLLQRVVPGDYRGRISGIWMMTWGTVVGGGLVAGALAGPLGAPLAALVGAGIAAAAVLAVIAGYRPVRELG